MKIKFCKTSTHLKALFRMSIRLIAQFFTLKGLHSKIKNWRCWVSHRLQSQIAKMSRNVGNRRDEFENTETSENIGIWRKMATCCSLEYSNNDSQEWLSLIGFCFCLLRWLIVRVHNQIPKLIGSQDCVLVALLASAL